MSKEVELVWYDGFWRHRESVTIHNYDKIIPPVGEDVVYRTVDNVKVLCTDIDKLDFEIMPSQIVIIK